jgi:exopolyphosphatase / guanosine-5'-triphosphate,3'-diphosphate pyrophosphatase
MHSNRKRPLVGVIDIGSNSVRFVVYDGLKRVPLALFNEKHHCGLGSGIQQTGMLSPQAKENTRVTLKRFAMLAQQMELQQLFAVATAAMRDAKDGAAFADELTECSGIPIRIIAGKEEAHLAAQGILASIYKPEGLAGDLGGGSLELVEVNQRSIKGQTSSPLGALRLLDAYGTDVESMRAHVRKILGTIDWLGDPHKYFYAIGGGFRTIASIHMHKTHYPLAIMHGYTIPTEELYTFCQWLMSLSAKEREQLDGLSSRRRDIFVPSVIIMQEILRMGNVEKVTFSASGIREGLLYDQLTPKIRKEKALMASLQHVMGGVPADPDYAQALNVWLDGLMMDEKDIQRKLRQAMCMLGDISLSVHPEFRADWAFEHIIQSSLWGISHRHRVVLALALYHRYRRKWRRNDAVIELLSERDKRWAAVTGQAASLAFEISGGAVEMLQQVRLKLCRGGDIQLSGDMELLRMLPPAVEKRLEGLSEAFKAYSNLSK